MKRIKYLVTKTMAENIEARRDDRILMIEVYKRMGLNFLPEQENFMRMAEFSASIFRARARIQNEEQRLQPHK